MRFERIEKILEAEPAYRDRLGPKDQKYEKKNGVTQFFSKGTVDVTWQLYNTGFDPHNCTRADVAVAAQLVLNEKRVSPVPKPVKKPEPKAQVKKPEPVKKPQAKQPPQAKQQPKPKPKAKPVAQVVAAPAEIKATAPVPTPAPAPAPVAAPAPVTHAEPVPAQETLPDAVAAPVPAPDPNKVPVYYIYASTFTMMASIKQLLDAADNQPGADGRSTRVDALMQELFDLKDVGVPLPMSLLPDSLKHGKSTSDSKG